MYLAGASAVTSIAPTRMCEFQFRILIDDTCVSTRLLLAFTWITSIILLSYFFLLAIASLVHLKHDSRIFHCYVHKFPWGEFRRNLPSAPASPSLPRFLKKMPSIVAPKPQRPVPAAIYTQHAGLGSVYEIESYATPVINADRPLPISSPASPIPIIQNSSDIPQRKQHALTSFYPQYIQSALTPEPLRSEPPHSRSQLQPPTQRQLQLHQPPPSEPPPLGNWPRPHQSSLPHTRTRNQPASAAPAPPAAALARNASIPPRPRPSGPRGRSQGESRVVMPDLPNVSSYQPGG
ncbi:hypothetical protein D9615_003871 [Tricholomella constricta]|uniref:Uncharacterized protein n=1 Tax=Tricholomella constricta TaxID=117010 RepID=A0A8H5HCY8_9AGAR|nr:hypothetical protein D9615_003871 [Tricholomella constricta]